MKKSIFILSLLALSVVFAGIAYADTVTATLAVSGTVLSTCQVQTTAVSFGNFDSSATDVYANGDVSVNCTVGTTYVIDIDKGANQGGQERYISNGANGIPYYLYKDSGLALEWGDLGHANTYPWGSGLSDTGNGSSQSHTVYGRLFFNHSAAPVSTYNDLVNVTVYY